MNGNNPFEKYNREMKRNILIEYQSKGRFKALRMLQKEYGFTIQGSVLYLNSVIKGDR